MDAIVRTYDPKLIIANFGSVPFTGYQEGTFISAERSGDIFEKSKGADGGIDRINKNAFDFRITVTLKQSSITNDILSGIMTADMLSNAGKFFFRIQDLNGTMLFYAPQAWIAASPNLEYSDSLSGREWVFDTGVAELFIGGNIL